MATEVVAYDDNDGEDAGLSDRQVAALDALDGLGATPRKDGEPYSPDRRIRAQQLIYEGRLGGPGRGQGRPRQPRASEAVAQYVKETLTPKIQKALKDGLREDEDITIRLKTADMALKVEREEAALQLKEDESDLANADKEQLIAALIALASDPGTEAALESADITLPESSVTDISDHPRVINGDTGTAEAPRHAGVGTPASAAEAGTHEGEAGSNGTGHDQSGRAKPPNPFTTSARRRAVNRRRAS